MVKVFRYAGFAEEASFNPDTAPAAQFHVDIASASLDTPTDPQLVYAGGLSRGARTHRPGAYSTAGDVVYAVDVATIGWFLKWAMGSYVYTAGVEPALNSHEMYASNDQILPSFTSRIGKDLFEHVFHGCGINSLVLESENEFITATMDVVGARDAKAVLQAKADLLLPDEFPLAFHEATVQKDASGISADVRSWTLTINNNLDAEAGGGQGSRHPYRLIAGEREVTLDMTLYYDGTDHLEDFWGSATGPSATGATEFALDFALDAGDDGQLDIALPTCIFTTVPQQPDGRSEITQEVSVKAFEAAHTLADGTTSVDSELLATLSNDTDEMVAVA